MGGFRALRICFPVLLLVFGGCGGEEASPGQDDGGQAESSAASVSAPGVADSDTLTDEPETLAEVPAVPVVEEKDPLGFVYEAEASRTVNGRPVFEYNPLADIRGALNTLDYRVVEGPTPGDPELHFQFSEVRFPGYAFQVMDGSGKKLLDERVFLIGGKGYVENVLGPLVQARLSAPEEDEATFLISQVKVGAALGHPVDSRLFYNNLNHLLRLYELTDPRATDTFVALLRSCDPRQRIAAKLALLNLGFQPRDEGERASWDMVNTLSGLQLVSMNFLREPEVAPVNPGAFGNALRLRAFIGMHGALGIERLVDDVRCNIMVPHVSWYGGGQVSEIEPERILGSLTEEAWHGSEWDPAWSEAVTASLQRVLDEAHPEMTAAQEAAYKEFAARVQAAMRGTDKL